MMFETLTEKFSSVIYKLNNKGRLTQDDIDEVLKDIRLALLDADVNFKVVKSFIKSVKEKILPGEILKALSPSQYVVKIVDQELTSILGGTSSELLTKTDNTQNKILMIGLNGSGKTTSSAKLALHLSNNNHNPLLIPADIHRPAAIEQLKILGDSIDIPVFDSDPSQAPEIIVKEGLKLAKSINSDFIIVDTAGRFTVDDDLMSELELIKDTVEPDEILLVVDAMTGQEAVNIAQDFNEKIGITGLILTKMDGDSRGGAALSISSVARVPVKFIGIGEDVTSFEIFHPDRLSSRILGMGDILTLAEKAQQSFDEDNMAKMEQKIRKATFDLEDFLDQMQAIKKMGSFGQILDMIPGISNIKNNIAEDSVNENHLSKVEAIIYSMTPHERQKPEIIGGSRRKRIATGSGTTPKDVNQLLNQFKQMRKMMKEMSSPKGQKKMMRMMSQSKGTGKLPF
ncbi:MAG: signal recognition particle protein [SAR202 cluster bacterium]|nr:signal recognition particle protein [Chloroflexota bacterium]MQG22934.1 signal recognition particle protein [SAR202 cluster bacterium]